METSHTLSRILSATILLGVCMSAHADWQYTRWGMSIDDVQKASGNTLQKGDSSERARGVGLKGTFATEKRSFEAEFYFDAKGQLTKVNLIQSTLFECGGTISDLQAKYGQPVMGGSSSFHTSQWRDEKGGNAIKFTDMSRATLLVRPGHDQPIRCTLSYQSLADTAPDL